MRARRPAPAFPARHRGFTLLEVMVSLALASVLMLAAYQLLDTTNRVSHSQIERTELQQSLRAAQTDLIRKIHVLGRGGLRSTFPPPTPGDPTDLGRGVAIAVRDQANVLAGDNSSPTVAAGTDLLVVRGSFENQIYYLNPNDTASLTINADGTGVVVIPALTPKGNLDQNLQAFADILAAGTREALLLVSAATEDTYGVVELDPGASAVTVDAATLQFNWTGGTNAGAMAALSSGAAFPGADLNDAKAATLAILEEYRYYVRDDESPPRLSRARVLPGTELAHPAPGSSLQDDLASGVVDLQIALGFDTGLDGAFDGRVGDAGNGTDDWLGNSTADAIDGAGAQDVLLGGADPISGQRDPGYLPPLLLVRVSTLGRASLADRSYLSPLLDRIEDNDYVSSQLNSPTDRKYRREVLQTVVEARNL